jgi:hypothetical protein
MRYVKQTMKMVEVLPEYLRGNCQSLVLSLYLTVATVVNNVSTISSTKAEALWRIMTTDCSNGQYPVSNECGFGISDWVSNQLLQIVNLATLSQKSIIESGKAKLKEALDYKKAMWSLLEQSDISGYYPLTKLEFLADALQSQLDEGREGEFKINLEA